mgnify:CR=1 FL=1
MQMQFIIRKYFLRNICVLLCLQQTLKITSKDLKILKIKLTTKSNRKHNSAICRLDDSCFRKHEIEVNLTSSGIKLR